LFFSNQLQQKFALYIFAIGIPCIVVELSFSLLVGWLLVCCSSSLLVGWWLVAGCWLLVAGLLVAGLLFI